MSFKPVDVISAAMDLSNSTVKTPEAESETPTRIQPPKLTPFSNGVLNRHAALHHHHHRVVVNYKECRRNHAVELGGHAVDGCGEFMSSPASNPSNPSNPNWLKCAACGCHRNFHRREHLDEVVPPTAITTPALEYQSHHRHHPPPPPPREDSESSPNNSPSPPPISSSYAPHMLLALSHGSGPPVSDTNPPNSGAINAESSPPFSSGNGRKRFRSKFTQNQKGKMMELAEKVGWKMLKREEDLIRKFCSEIGVEKGVFKVWMHNNKSNYGKRDNLPEIKVATSTPPADSTVNGNGVSCRGVGYPPQDQENSSSKQNLHDYGSSSS